MIALLVVAMGFAQTKQLAPTYPALKLGNKNGKAVISSKRTNTRAITGTLTHAGGDMNPNGLGIDEESALAAASIFTASELTSYVGQYITRINLGLADASVITSAKVAIFTGSVDEPVLAYEQEFTATDGYNVVFLTEPYQIPASTDIMIGYEVYATEGYPIGVDFGPIVENVNLLALGTFEDGLATFDAYSLGFNLFISATVEDAIGPVLVAYPNTLSFVGFVGEGPTDAKTVNVLTYNYSGDITVTASTSFEVSADNTTWGTTATMSEAGNFHVRYVPESVENLNVTGTITIAGTGAETQTINLTAQTYDCSETITLPYSEDFNSSTNYPRCWGVEYTSDVNAPVIAPVARYGEFVNDDENNNYFWFSSYNEADDYNQYLITPELSTATPIIFSFDYYCDSYNYEYLRVGYSTTTKDIEAFTWGEEIVAIPEELANFLQEYPAGTKYIAINYYNEYQYYVGIDNISIIETPTTQEIALTSVTPATGATVIANGNINLGGVITNNGADLTSFTASYSIDGAEAVSQTFTLETPVAFGQTYAFTFDNVTLAEADEYEIVVTVSNPNGVADGDDTDNSLTITINAVSCDPISTFPYTENFDSGFPACWRTEDFDGDGYNWGLSSNAEVEITPHSGTLAMSSASYINASYAPLNANNWMITQAIAVPAEGEYLATWYELSQDPSYPDSYSVYVGTSNEVEDLVATTPALSRTAEGEWTPQSVSLAAYAGQTIYIAFQHQSYNKFILAIDDFSVVEAPAEIEFALTSVTPADGASVTANEDINLTAVITNNGATLNSYKVSYTIDGGATVTETIENLTFSLGQVNTFTFDNVTLEPGEHTIVVTISEPNGATDGNVADNTMTINITAVDCGLPATIPYTEDFNNGISVCYTILDANNDDNTWQLVQYGDAGTDFVALYPMAQTSDDYMITEGIAFDAGNYTVSFDYAASQYGIYGAVENLKVFLGNAPTVEAMNAGTVIVDLQEFTNSSYTTSTNNISIAEAGTYYIGFYAYSTNGFYLYFDNLSVVRNTTSIDENIASAIAVYPNPTNSMVTIANAEGQNITVVNSLGQVVASIENADANQTIDVTNFANGTYFVKVNAEVVKLNVVK